MEVLDHHGDMVELGAAPETDTEKEYQTFLVIAEEEFAIITQEQRRKYKELVTHPAYANVFAQFRLIQRFLPVPDAVLPLMEMDRDRRKDDRRDTGYEGTPRGITHLYPARELGASLPG
jgi:hypothetical protein